ncbi:MAG: hemerythrin family protein [Candidatus Marinimicrobia bacterium]|nr:hemerythrin family protein [Candidatus Neomarinimicrobiota bacterium]
MEHVVWKDEYSVKNEIIDAQHKSLCHLINELIDCSKDETKCKLFESIIDKLIKYVEVHFATEEKYFKETDFILADQHIEEHQNFIQKVNDVAGDFYSMQLAETEQILEFLTTWLQDHILNTDQKYVEHFQKYLGK